MEYLTADFDYYLPKNLIANKPANPKEASRLLDCREQKNIVDLQRTKDEKNKNRK